MSKQTFENFKKLWEEEIAKIRNESIDGDGVRLINLHFDLNKHILIMNMSSKEFTGEVHLELEMLESKLEIALQIAHSRFRLKNRGILANVFGKVSPLRMNINRDCTNCHKCSASCRYGALSPEDINKRRPGLPCTLCGDCVGSCKDGFITYRFPGINPKHARAMFVVLVVSIHSVCLGVARI